MNPNILSSASANQGQVGLTRVRRALPRPPSQNAPASPSNPLTGFSGLIGDSFSRGVKTQHSFMSSSDFTASMGEICL